MTFLVRSREQRGDVEDVLTEMRGRRTGGRGATGSVPRAQAFRISAMWAALRLRADLVSTMPIDVFRRSKGQKFDVPKPPVMLDPAGDGFGWEDWLYQSQIDLDSLGNTIGVIEEIDSVGLPRVIRLVCASDVSIGRQDGQLYYRHGGVKYDPKHIWHERQYPIAGAPFGLSPVAYAALTMQPTLSASQFAALWFGSSATPGQHLRNTAKVLKKGEARATKDRFNAQVEDGGLFVSGKDWELKLLSAKASESMFLEQIKASATDAVRYVGVPGDMIDAESSTGAITYANVTQRNLQLLIMHLNPALIRRERAFTNRLLPAPRMSKFNRGALLQMDLKTRYEAHGVGITNRFLTPDEARDHEDLPPLTDEQKAQFKELWPEKPQPNPGGPQA